ncbi:radical SAM protein [Magnetococcales bacterium HHB-1]
MTQERRGSKILLIAPLVDTNVTRDNCFGVPGDNTKIVQTISAPIATVAAFVPDDFEIQVCDEAIQDLDFDAEVDIVGITANVVQAERAIEIAKAFKKRGKTVVMGGLHVSLMPEYFADHVDAIVIGELESVAERLFDDLRAGRLKPRYQGSRTDLHNSPPPRWDLFPHDHVLISSVQISRGCPFDCSFCSVVQYLGHKQRHKRTDQVISEIQTLYDYGYTNIYLSDDNLTANKQKAHEIISAVRDWNGKNGREWIVFAAQASIDLADDPALTKLCHQAGILDVFVGFETNSPQALKECNKKPNLEVDLADQCYTLVRAGLRVEPGLIVGFDSDDHSIFQKQFEFFMSLPVAGIRTTMLIAPITTRLYREMKAQNRIRSEEIKDHSLSDTFSTNIIPAQMSMADLHTGYVWLNSRLYHPDNFLARFDLLAETLAPSPWIGQEEACRRMRPNTTRLASSFMRDVMRSVPQASRIIRHASWLMKKHPEIKNGLTSMLQRYLIDLRIHIMKGLYNPEWAEASAPPFAQKNQTGSCLE